MRGGKGEGAQPDSDEQKKTVIIPLLGPKCDIGLTLHIHIFPTVKETRTNAVAQFNSLARPRARSRFPRIAMKHIRDLSTRWQIRFKDAARNPREVSFSFDKASFTRRQIQRQRDELRYLWQRG